MPLEKTNMKVSANGKVGNVYKTQIGNEIWNLGSDEGELEQGWEQITPTERRFVVRRRTSHSHVAWQVPKKEPRPMDHKKDGALF